MVFHLRTERSHLTSLTPLRPKIQESPDSTFKKQRLQMAFFEVSCIYSGPLQRTVDTVFTNASCTMWPHPNQDPECFHRHKTPFQSTLHPDPTADLISVITGYFGGFWKCHFPRIVQCARLGLASFWACVVCVVSPIILLSNIPLHEYIVFGFSTLCL